MKNVHIRQETERDHKKIYELIKTSFATAEHSDGTEQDLIEKLRKSKAYIQELALVAECDERIVGYIMFTKVKVGRKVGLALAPLAVVPDFQRQGVGSALINKGHEIAKRLGFEFSLVLGSEKYYPKFGYISAEECGVEIPKDFPSSNFFIKPLQKNFKHVSGQVVYPNEFGL